MSDSWFLLIARLSLTVSNPHRYYSVIQNVPVLWTNMIRCIDVKLLIVQYIHLKRKDTIICVQGQCGILFHPLQYMFPTI
jgi:hypothetical protein